MVAHSAACFQPTVSGRLSTAAPSRAHRSSRHTLGARVIASVETSRVKVEGAVKTKQLTLKMAAANLPHPDKADYGGEDAYFTSAVGGGALGVADGVGGWADSGVNPAEYSKTLLSTARAVIEGSVDVPTSLSRNNSEFSISVLETIDAGDAELDQLGLCVRTSLAVAHSQTRLPGSATACVLRLDQRTSEIKAANLGDSGFIVVRNGKVVFKTRALEHFFDCPYQFGSFPEHTDATDTVDDADTYDIAVQKGDVIVAGTDGLWDNCYEHEMIPMLPTSVEAVEMAAEKVAALARANSNNPSYESPYTADARAQGLDLPPWQKLLGSSFKNGKFELGKLQGGKQDDITVVIAYVAEEEQYLTPHAVNEADAQIAAAEADI